MINILEIELTQEQIYLIRQCEATERKEILKELQGYLKKNSHDEDMLELIQKTIDKVWQLTQDELEQVLNYPIE